MSEYNRKNKRFGLLDALRGITLISMILFHASWDLVFLYGKDWTWYSDLPGYIWQQSICWTFIFLSGFCWNFGRNHLKRGGIVFAGGVVISLVTLVFMPDSRIVFGILTFLGSAMLVMAVIHPLMKKIPAEAGMFLSALSFFFCRNVNRGSLGFERFIVCQLPGELYNNILTTFFGFPHPGFFSTDYFSFLPWFFLFLAGYYFYGIMERRQWMHCLYWEHCKGLQWIGRHSLILYMLHQPVIFGLLQALHMLGAGI